MPKAYTRTLIEELKWDSNVVFIQNLPVFSPKLSKLARNDQTLDIVVRILEFGKIFHYSIY